MKIQHVKLSNYAHFLVVDGVRGPLCTSGAASPATHPAGVMSYLPFEPYNSQNKELAGKVFAEMKVDVERIEDTACEPAQEAYKVYQEITKTCTEVKLARYGEEAAPAKEAP